MAVGDQDSIESAETNARAQNLTLSAFPAVDQEAIVTKTDDLGAESAVDGRSRGRSAQEQELEQAGTWMG